MFRPRLHIQKKDILSIWVEVRQESEEAPETPSWAEHHEGPQDHRRNHRHRTTAEPGLFLSIVPRTTVQIFKYLLNMYLQELPAPWGSWDCFSRMLWLARVQSVLDRLAKLAKSGPGGARQPRPWQRRSSHGDGRGLGKDGEKTERDLQEDGGGAGVYSGDLTKLYELRDDSWRHDAVPEIMDGHNIAGSWMRTFWRSWRPWSARRSAGGGGRGRCEEDGGRGRARSAEKEALVPSGACLLTQGGR